MTTSMGSRATFVVRAGAVACTLVLALACAEPPRERYAERLGESAPAARHAVHSDRLRAVMQRMERLSDERLPRALDVEATHEARIAELEEVARGIADSTERIPQAAWQADLTEPDRVELHQLAALLREQALALAEGAAAMSPAERTAAVDELEDTCQRCHARFRISRGRDGG